MSVGIVCEFNPFHNGHKYLIETVKRQTGQPVVCAMSGFFVQRGEAAFCPPKQRAEWAISAGADLVLENPFPFSCASAEHFAKGAISVLCGSGLCDTLAFGAEDGSESEFFELARILLDKNTQKDIQNIVKSEKNIGFARARSMYIESKYGNLSRLLGLPNSLLGIEYAKASLSFGKKINLVIIPRIGADHDGTPFDDISPASYLRESTDINRFSQYCPGYVADYFASNEPFFTDDNMVYAALSAILLTRSEQYISGIAEVPHGYASKLREAARKHSDFVGFFDSIKSKHMTNAHLRRMIIYILADVQGDILKSAPTCSRLLAFSDAGAKLLRQMKKDCCDFTVLSKVSDMKQLKETELLREQKSLFAEKLFMRMKKNQTIS